MSNQGKRGLTNDERFFAFVKVSDHGCHEWEGHLDKDGYGVFWDSVEKKNIRAHRYALRRAGLLPTELHACHRCDNPRCVRVDHLFAGSGKDNMDDKAAKGRTKGFASMKGEQHTQSKLTEQDVREIKLLLSQGQRQMTIAKMFSVADSVISRINTGKIWKNVSI